MVGIARLLDDSWPLLIAATTALLLVGCGLMVVTRSPAHRQRTGELTLAVILGWLALACLPLPRLLPEGLLSRRTVLSPPAENGNHFSINEALAPTPRSTSATAPTRSLAGEATVGETATVGPVGPSELVSLSSTSLRGTNDWQTIDSAATIDGGSISLRGTSLAANEAWSPLTVAYLGGFAVCVVWLGCGWLWLACLRHSAGAAPSWLADLFESLLANYGSHPRPLLLVSERCVRPISWGTWRPVILLPLALVRPRRREALRMVLLHELAHVARRDSWGNVLFCLALPLLYAHPLFWWLRAQVRLAAELVADEWAAQRTGKLAYIEQLVAVARLSPPGLMPVTGAISLYSSPSQFYRRMQMLLTRENTLSIHPSAGWRRLSLTAAGVVVVLAAAAIGARPAVGQPAPEGAGAADQKVADSKPAEQASPPADQPASAAPAEERPLYPPPLQRLFTVADTQPAEEQTREALRQMLRAKLAAAQQQIRALEAELSALEAGDKSAQPPATPAAEPPHTSQKTVMLSRVNEDGSISTEGWSTGDDGRPQKLMWKKLSHTATDSPISAAKPGTMRDGQVVKEFKRKDGTIVRHFYDAQTGRLFETLTVPAKDSSPEAPASEPRAGVSDDLVVGRRAPDKPQASSDRDGGSAAGLDLVSLATAYADSVGSVDTAKAQLAAVEEAAANKTVSQRELEAARIALHNAQRKHQLLRNIAKVAAEAAKADLERSQQLVRAGAMPVHAAAEADARWKILNEILSGEPPANAPQPEARPR